MSDMNGKELPEGWKWVRLGDIGEYINGRGFKKSEWSDNGLPIIRIQDLTGTGKEQNFYNGVIDERHIVKTGDLLISWSATLGAFIWDGPEAALNQHIFKVKSLVDKKLHFYIIKDILDKLYRQAHGSGMVHITKTKFDAIPILIPETLDQQKQIVAKIEELFSHIDAGIAALKQAKLLLKQYRQSVLKAAVTGELTKEWREANRDKLEPASKLLERILKERREKWEEQQMADFKKKGKVPKDDTWKAKYREPAGVKDAEGLPELPDGWAWVSVDQAGDSQDQVVLTGPFGSNLGKEDFTKSGIPVLTIGCLQEDGIKLSRAMFVSKLKSEDLIRYKLKVGDLLFSRMAAVGRVGFVTSEFEGALFNYHIMRLRLHPDAILQKYFVFYVRGSSQVFDYVREVNHGATRDGINTQQLLEMPVAFPPIEEQKEIEKIVDNKLISIRRVEVEIERHLLKAERTKQSILAAAFSGKLVGCKNE